MNFLPTFSRTIIVLLVAFSSLKAQEGDVDLGAQVQTIFVAKCANCHGLKIRKPKGSFGFVEDLDRVRAEYSNSTDLEESDIWYYIAEAEDEIMPPPKSKNGPLSKEEIALVKKWVLAGSPSPKPKPIVDPKPNKTSQGSDVESATRSAIPTTPPLPEEDSGLGFLGFMAAIHPVLVHFPIALIMVAVLMEFLRIRQGNDWREPIRLLLLLVVTSSILAGYTGFQAQDYDGLKDDTVWNHKWCGIAGSILALVALLLMRRAAELREGWKTWLFRICLVLSAILIGYAGHEGGLLAFGADHFG